MKSSLGISDIFEEISSLSHFTVFLYFFALIAEEGFLILLPVLWNSAFKCKEIQPDHPKEDQSWVFIERTDVEAETPILWPPDAKS